jgi:hypothetical protein
MANNIAQVSDDTFDRELLQSVFFQSFCSTSGPPDAGPADRSPPWLTNSKIGKLNVIDNPRTPARYEWVSLFCSLSKTDTSSSRSVGVVPKTHLVKALATVVSSERSVFELTCGRCDLEQQERSRR